ncbi:MAG: ABC transporter ATP-binding protein [Clostridia bacterium]|nr:ABC transporter ATP-binding protein [Clostridia bacterium]
MIELRHITKVYETKSGSVTALSDVCLEFGECGLVFILGKSGSGKTTLLNMIGGLDMPTGGELVIDGRSSNSFKGRDYDLYRNEYVGFVFQEYNLIDDYSVGTNIGLAMELQGRKADKTVINNLMRRLELTDSEGGTLYPRHISELSGGQKQRVAIARALVKNPKVILADEPTGALDSETGRQLYELLKELSKDRLIIVVSHDRESAVKYGDRIVEIADGKVARDSQSEEAGAV